MCKWVEWGPLELEDGFWSLRGPPPGPGAERGALNGEPQPEEWGHSGASVKDWVIWNLLILSSVAFFFHVSRSVSSFLSLQLFRAVRVSHTALSFEPLTSYLPLFLPPLFLFFLSTPFSFSLYSPFNLFSISRCICALQVLGWTDKHWLGFGGCRGGGMWEKSGGLTELSPVFLVVVVTVALFAPYQLRFHMYCHNGGFCARPAFFLSCCFNCCSRWRTTKPHDFYFQTNMFALKTTALRQVLIPWCVLSRQ